MQNKTAFAVALLGASLVVLSPSPARGHCDTLDGPVITDAQAALAQRDVTPVLKWVPADREIEVRDVFGQTLAVRALGPEARELADRHFFETLVRVHREAEGAPYTGLKPAGREIDPAIAASDKALETGSVETLVKMITAEVEQGLRERFEKAMAAKTHAKQSVGRGRDYVAAYVQFIHYAEGLRSTASGGAHAEQERAEASKAHVH